MGEKYDLIIVGCGPAAVQLAVRLEELAKNQMKKINYIIIERNSEAGSFFNTYPVHKNLISNNKLYTGASRESEFSERFDWNSILMEDDEIQARDYTTDFYPKSSLIPRMLKDIVDKFQIPICFNEEVLEIQNEDGEFVVTTEKSKYKSEYVVVATGFKPRIPDIVGYELTTPYERMRHRSYYRDKSVFIIGKGNSALECAGDIMNEANMIICASPSSICFAYQTHYVGSPRLVNAVPIENYQLKSMSSMLDCNILEIKRDQEGEGVVVTVSYTHAKGEVEEIRVDEVICATGFVPNFPITKPECVCMKSVWPNIDGKFESRDVGKLYFAGALTHGLDYKQYSSSGFIHGFRYNAISLAENLYAIITGSDVTKTIAHGSLTNYIFDRINNNSGIYLQPGFLGVHLIVDEKRIIDCGYCSIIAFEEMDLSSRTHLLITLEYGDIIKHMRSPLNIERDPGVPEASVHLHPVIRIQGEEGYEKVALEENLFNKFDSSEVNVKIVQKLERDLI